MLWVDGQWRSRLHELANQMCYSGIIDKEVRRNPGLFYLCKTLGFRHRRRWRVGIGEIQKRGGVMAAKLTDKQKKKIIADYIESGSYSATARKHKVSATTVRNLVNADEKSAKKFEQKKEENSKSILAHMESQRDVVNEIITKGLDVLNSREKLESATPSHPPAGWVD